MVTPEVARRMFEVMGKMFDSIVVDLAQLMDGTALKTLELADTLFLVAVQTLPCLANTNKLLRSIRDLGYPPLDQVRIILNRYLKHSAIELDDVEESLKTKIYWKIPNDYQTAITSINKSKPLLRIAPKEPITQSFQDLAALLVTDTEGAEKKKKWWIF